jgi:hypothetical protein
MRVIQRAALGLLLATALLFCQTKPPYEPLSILHKYPAYTNCAEFTKATGKTCPAWDSSKAPKYWFDPAPKRSLTLAGVPCALYDLVFAGNYGEGGAVVLEQLVISLTDAAQLNIPPIGPGMEENVPGAGRKAIPVPLNTPSVTQKVVGLTPMGVPMVRNLDVPVSESDAQQGEVLKLLRAIAAKLGVSP